MAASGNPLVDGLRRVFGLGALGLIVVGLAMATLYVVDGRVHSSAALSRDLIGIGRRAHSFSIERQSAVRGYVLSGRGDHHRPTPESWRVFARTIDSLVAASSGDERRMARAHDVQRAISRSERAYVKPVLSNTLGSQSEAAHAIAGDELFDAVRAAIGVFIQAEERNLASRVEYQAMARRIWLAGLLLPILLVAGATVLYGRRLFAYARETVEAQERLEDQGVELERQTAQLEEHAVQLEEQNEESRRLAGELAAANEGLMATVRELEAARVGESAAKTERARVDGLLELLIDASPVGIGLFDSELRLTVVNDAMAGINRKPRSELLGKRTGELVDPDLAEEAEELLRGVLDTTERKEFEVRLVESQKMEAVGRLAGGVAHDFNNLLTAIRSYSELLLEEMDEWSQHRPDVEEINKAAIRAAELTHKLLAFSRQQMLRPQHLDINAVVSKMENMLERLAGTGVAMNFRLEARPSTVKADPIEIERVIVNLVLNARDAMPDGGTLTVETRNVELDSAYVKQNPESAPGPHVLLCVSDTGVGMTRDVREKLFEPFFTTKKRADGAGMGLSSIYGIVRQSGGHISVSSEPGQGTRFEVYLPRDDSPDAEPRQPVVKREPRSSAVILLVEDDDIVRSVARRILVKAGFEVHEAVNGRDAMEKCTSRDHDIDMVLTDIEMPEMNGAELAERLKAKCPDMRFLFMSGYTEDRVLRDKLIQPGAPFLEKPFTPGVLVERVREVLSAGAAV